MLEKRLSDVAPVLFVANGTVDGLITVADTKFFKVKQLVNLKSNTQQLRNLEVKQVISPTQMRVGPISSKINEFSDISDLTIADGATIGAKEQPRPNIPSEEVNRAVYEEEPTVALRTVNVDQYGRKIDSVVDSSGKVRLAVDGTFTAEVDVQVDVDVDGEYNPITNPDPDNIGLIGHSRAVSPTQINQTERITAVQGGIDTDHHAVDVALNDQNGNGLDSNFGSPDRGLRTAAIPGNASGIADFNAGPTTAQTPRTSANIRDENGVPFSDTNYLPVGQTTHDNLNLNANAQQNDQDVSITNPLYTQTTNGNLETTQQEVLTELQDVNSELNDQTAILQEIEQDTDQIISEFQAANNSLDNIEADVDSIRVATESLDNKTNNNYGSSTGGIRTASQIGNATGAADFNVGATTAQTLRTVANLSTGNGVPVTATTSAGSKNSANFLSPDNFIAGTLNSLASTLVIATEGLSSTGFQISAGTFRGTVIVETSSDGGVSYGRTAFYDFFNSTSLKQLIYTANNTAATLTVLTGGGTSHVRVSVSAFTSGTCNITLRSSNSVGAVGAVTSAAYGTITNYTVNIPTNTPTLGLVANANRKYVYISNSSNQTVRIQFGSGTGLSASTGLTLAKNLFYEIKGDNLFLGDIYVFCASAVKVSISEGIV